MWFCGFECYKYGVIEFDEYDKENYIKVSYVLVDDFGKSFGV